MINEFALPGPKCGDADSRPSFILRVHYLYFAILLAGITFIISAAVSLLTPPINRRYLLRPELENKFSISSFLQDYFIKTFC